MSRDSCVSAGCIVVASGCVQGEPWGRRADESRPAFEAFRTYLEMGTGRDIRSVGRSLGKSGSLISRWSSRHSWVARAKAWDDHLGALARAAAEEHTVRRAATFASERDQRIDSDLELGRALLQKAREIVARPIHEVTYEDDGRTVIIRPLDLRDLQIAANIAAKGQDITWRALEAGLALERENDAKGGMVGASEAALAEGARRVAALRARFRSELLVQPGCPTPEADDRLTTPPERPATIHERGES